MLFKIVVLLSLLCVTLSLTKCPKPKSIKPCKCYPKTQEIHCVGNQVNDRVMDEILRNLNNTSNRKFKLFYILNTRITKIRRDLFPFSKFEAIYLNRNLNLRRLEIKGNKDIRLKSLIIGNQPNLTIVILIPY